MHNNNNNLVLQRRVLRDSAARSFCNTIRMRARRVLNLWPFMAARAKQKKLTSDYVYSIQREAVKMFT